MGITWVLVSTSFPSDKSSYVCYFLALRGMDGGEKLVHSLDCSGLFLGAVLQSSLQELTQEFASLW